MRDTRYELKYTVAADDARAAGLDLALRALGYRTLHPERVVQSLYLDAPDRAAVRDNLAGISRREKLRVRWYGEAVRGVRAALERKVREAGVGWKQTEPLAGALDVEGAERQAFCEELRTRLPGVEALARELEPAQWVRYRRSYLTSPDGLVRLTVDRELVLSDQRRRPRLALDELARGPAVWILELKCPVEEVDALRENAARLPLVSDKSSKFMAGEEPSARPRACRIFTASRGWRP